MFEVENITVQRVERVFNIVGKLIKDNTGTQDTEDLIFLKDTILPIIREYESEFTRKLLNSLEIDQECEIKFNMSGFARATMEKRGNFYQQMNMIPHQTICIQFEAIHLAAFLHNIEKTKTVFTIFKDQLPINTTQHYMIDAAARFFSCLPRHSSSPYCSIAHSRIKVKTENRPLSWGDGFSVPAGRCGHRPLQLKGEKRIPTGASALGMTTGEGMLLDP